VPSCRPRRLGACHLEDRWRLEQPYRFVSLWHALKKIALRPVQLCVLVASLAPAIGLGGCPGGAHMESPKLSAEVGMTEVVVRLRPQIARVLQGIDQDAPGASQLRAVLSRFGAELKPQHPGTQDPGLQSYFVISGVSATQADSIAAALRRLESVEAAYVQPIPIPP